MKKINLDELTSNLEMPSNDMNVVYNKETGEFISIMEDDVRKVENAESLEELIEDCPEWQKDSYKQVYEILFEDEESNYIYLPTQFDRDDAMIMGEFIDTLDNPRQASELSNCMWQNHMYRKYKDKLYELNLEDKYYEFYAEKMKELAIEWCKENELEYE